MKYKFIDEHTVKPYKKGFVVLDNKIYTNPKDEIIAKAGYKDLVVQEEPEYDMLTQYTIPHYTDGDVITQSWEIKEIEEELDNNSPIE